MADTIFTDGTLESKDKLGMVNICLNAIGEIPLESGTVLSDLQAGTDGAIARDLVAKTMLEVQNEGWFFNIDFNFEFIPDSEGFIAIPVNILRIDSGKTIGRQDYVLRSGKLYSLRSQSFIFNQNVFLDIVYIVDYLDLPFTAYNYIAYRAATLFERATIASPDLGNNARINEAEAKTLLVREDAQTMDYNLLTRVSNRGVNPDWNQD